MTPRTCFLTIFLLFPVEATVWPEFRGPNAQGVVKASNVPSKMGQENLVWKREIPGAGWSSPVMSSG